MQIQKTNSLIDQIYELLKNQILQGTLSDGEKLSENTLAFQFSCSRTPVREALKRLEQDGFVSIIAHSGSYVRDTTMTDYQQLTEVRAYLEALAIRLNCENHVLTAPLEAILDAMDEISTATPLDIQAFSKLHYQFHLTLVELTQNELLSQTYKRLNLSKSALLFSQNLNSKGIKKTQEEHRRLVEAIKEGNTKAGEHFMLSHLWRKRDRFKIEAESV